ncbi:MAG: DMT family transporter [Vagococcus sp.]
MAWLSLIFAGLFEMLGVNSINVYLKQKSIKNMLVLVICFSISFYLLSLAINVLLMSTAYAIWTGIGASGGAIMGILFFNEPRDTKRIMGILFFNEPRDTKRIMWIVVILMATLGLKIIS